MEVKEGPFQLGGVPDAGLNGAKARYTGNVRMRVVAAKKLAISDELGGV